MSYAYCCPYCGESHQTNDLLIDLTPIFFFNHFNRSFQFLKLRMTVGELMAIVSKTSQSQEKKPWVLSLDILMSIVANQYNLNDPAIQNITLEEIDEYLGWFMNDADYPSIFCDSIFTDLFETLAVGEDASIPDFKPSDSLSALLNKKTDMSEVSFMNRSLEHELEAIQDIYHKGNPELFVNPISTNGVTTHFHLIYNNHHFQIKNRLCPTCSDIVPERACTVPQKLVGFLGDNLTYKTTTLLALTHYALNGSSPYCTHTIWKDAEKLPQVRCFDLLNPSEDLRKDLRNYECGISPPKYGLRRQDLPIAHLFITSTEGKQAILTLINPPGELYNIDEQIDVNLLFGEFPAVLRSDVLIHCVSQRNIINEFCIPELECAESLMMYLTNKGYFPPVLTLFTDLPSDHPNDNHSLFPNRINMLQSEYDDLLKNPITADYLRMTSSFSRMSMDSTKVYRNTMHCHPLGYNTPIVYSHHVHDGVEPVPPVPENIPLLMHWILSATGILPASYIHPMTGKRYYSQITRRQFRQKAPISRKEAIARCILFLNPSQQDKSMADVQNALPDDIPTNEGFKPDSGVPVSHPHKKDEENNQKDIRNKAKEPNQQKTDLTSKPESTITNNNYYGNVYIVKGDVNSNIKGNISKDNYFNQVTPDNLVAVLNKLIEQNYQNNQCFVNYLLEQLEESENNEAKQVAKAAKANPGKKRTILSTLLSTISTGTSLLADGPEAAKTISAIAGAISAAATRYGPDIAEFLGNLPTIIP